MITHLFCNSSFSGFKFIAYTIDAFHIIWQVWGNPDLLPEVAYMVVDCLSGIIGIILMPHQIQKHLIGEYPFRIHYEQSKDVKFFDR